MSYEEPKYTVVSETDTYEVRRYKIERSRRSLLSQITADLEFFLIIFQELTLFHGSWR